ncbi:hypothetical protein [Aquipseudomonas alcaligenes]|uniref:hypothetical protein n=1 Tax=Aquipseudomonas alcaligenes TaxID=43263 RepID=UPI003669BBA2
MHDWWIALIASYFGKIGYVERVTVKYRQHAKNTVGVKGFDISAAAHLISLLKYLIFRDNDCLSHLAVNLRQARAFLETFENDLDNEARTMLVEFINLGQKKFLQRRLTLVKYRLLKQGFVRNAGLLVRI